MTAVIPPGNDANDPLALLKDELARVSPSSGFAAGVRERLAASSEDHVASLREALEDLSPTPDFAVRVRQRIDADRARRRAWLSMAGGRWLVPATGVAAGLLAVVLWPRSLSEPQAPSTAVAVVRPAPSPVAPSAGSSSTPQGAPPERLAPSRSSRVQQTVSRLPPPARDPMLEVITNQPVLLRALRPSISRPGVTVDATDPIAMYEPPKIEVPRIEVGPIPAYVLPDTRWPIGVTPFILRIAADSAERSSR